MRRRRLPDSVRQPPGEQPQQRREASNRPVRSAPNVRQISFEELCAAKETGGGCAVATGAVSRKIVVMDPHESEDLVQCRIARTERPVVVNFVVRDFTGNKSADQLSRQATPFRLYDSPSF